MGSHEHSLPPAAPTNDELFEALGSLRPDPAEFADGVGERIRVAERFGPAVGTAEGAAEGAAEGIGEPSGRPSVESRSTPRWLKAAATLAPPAAVKSAKAASAAKAGKGLSVVLWAWAWPFVILFAGGAALMRSSKGMSEELDDEQVEEAQSILGDTRLLVSQFSLLTAALLALMFAPVHGPWIAGAAGLAWFGYLSSRVKGMWRGAQAGIFAAQLGTFTNIAFAMNAVDASRVILPAAGILLAGSALCVRTVRRERWSGVPSQVYRSSVVLALVLGGMILAKELLHLRIGRDANPPADPVAFASGLGDLGLTGWEIVGAIPETLGPDALSPAELERLAGLLKVEGDWHPKVTGAALGLGLVAPDQYAAELDRSWSRRPRFPSVGYTYAGGLMLEIADAKARGLYDSDMEDQLAVCLRARWPQPGIFRSIAKLEEALRIAAFAGLDEVYEEGLRDAKAILDAGWTGARAKPGAHVGFEPLNEPPPGKESWKRPEIASDVGESLRAVRIMLRLDAAGVNVAEHLQVDLAGFRGYLLDESRPYRVEEPLGSHLEASLALSGLDRLENTIIPLPAPPTIVERLLPHALSISALIGVLLCWMRLRKAPSELPN